MTFTTPFKFRKDVFQVHILGVLGSEQQNHISLMSCLMHTMHCIGVSYAHICSRPQTQKYDKSSVHLRAGSLICLVFNGLGIGWHGGLRTSEGLVSQTMPAVASPSIDPPLLTFGGILLVGDGVLLLYYYWWCWWCITIVENSTKVVD